MIRKSEKCKEQTRSTGDVGVMWLRVWVEVSGPIRTNWVIFRCRAVKRHRAEEGLRTAKSTDLDSALWDLKAAKPADSVHPFSVKS